MLDAKWYVYNARRYCPGMFDLVSDVFADRPDDKNLSEICKRERSVELAVVFCRKAKNQYCLSINGQEWVIDHFIYNRLMG